MRIFRWIFGIPEEEQLVTVILPSSMVSAIDTLIYMDKTHYVNRADVVSDALDDFLKRRLWVAKDKTDYVTQIKHVDTFRSPSAGIKQNKSSL